jgi:hypothetical protein
MEAEQACEVRLERPCCVAGKCFEVASVATVRPTFVVNGRAILVPRTGFEPVISSLKGWRARPLHQRGARCGHLAKGRCQSYQANRMIPRAIVNESANVFTVCGSDWPTVR